MSLSFRPCLRACAYNPCLTLVHDTPAAIRLTVAYFTGETLERLLTIDDIPELAAIRNLIPPGKYTTARMARQRVRADTAGPALFGPDVKPDAGPSSFSLSPPHPLPHAPTRLPLYKIDQDMNLPPPHPRADVHLPALKPPPWSPPRWLEDELATRQPDLNAAQSQRLRRNPTIDLAPLIYLRKRPYPPRDVADDDILQKFDCGIV